MEVIQIICIEYRKDKLHLRKTKYYPSNFIKEIDFQIWVSIPINNESKCYLTSGTDLPSWYRWFRSFSCDRLCLQFIFVWFSRFVLGCVCGWWRGSYLNSCRRGYCYWKCTMRQSRWVGCGRRLGLQNFLNSRVMSYRKLCQLLLFFCTGACFAMGLEIWKLNMMEMRARGILMIIENHLSLVQMKYLYRCRGLRRKIHWSFFVRAFGWGDSSFLLFIRRRPECMLILWRGGCFEFFFVILVSIWKVFWTSNCCICIGRIKLYK